MILINLMKFINLMKLINLLKLMNLLILMKLVNLMSLMNLMNVMKLMNLIKLMNNKPYHSIPTQLPAGAGTGLTHAGFHFQLFGRGGNGPPPKGGDSRGGTWCSRGGNGT